MQKITVRIKATDSRNLEKKERHPSLFDYENTCDWSPVTKETLRLETEPRGGAGV